ncbi:phosphoadenosine phosphosulfate reductase domain-containing protein [Pedobacter gandavensis]|uniref:Phosphoadenosine phosphosulfate reductase family protein n=1 Tax=Pedobacter gandavensis TaxID=2679963 RepID=A0ABR6EV26_9SPHI|nr:phosphoadenosine phosphosulfate reductase family protein [Pedobacter gandavensis]MBB2148831.1 phosphoadenosine phosphosulfate reductase family protein [Pedobacter gandavensis]
MKHIVLSSTGKDSEAAMWWAFDNLPFNDWEVIFSDLQWDDQAVYKHMEYLESRIGKTFLKIKSSYFQDRITEETRLRIIEIFGHQSVFAEMVMYRSRFPSTRRRFCTEDLKVRPVIDYILDNVLEDLVLIQGVRAEESAARRNLKATDDYFKFYLEPFGYDKNGKPKFHTYRKADVLAHLEKYDVIVSRPILKLTHSEVFNVCFNHNSPANPLYRSGSSRVGCYPCIMCQLGEVRLIAINSPKRIDQIDQLEQLSGSTFFPHGYIPSRFCTKTAEVKIYREDLIKLFSAKSKKPIKGQSAMFDASVLNPEERLYQMYFKNDHIAVYLDESGDEFILRMVKVPTIKDVVKYVIENPNQMKALVSAPGCVSVYNICEAVI